MNAEQYIKLEGRKHATQHVNSDHMEESGKTTPSTTVLTVKIYTCDFGISALSCF